MRAQERWSCPAWRLLRRAATRASRMASPRRRWPPSSPPWAARPARGADGCRHGARSARRNGWRAPASGGWRAKHPSPQRPVPEAIIFGRLSRQTGMTTDTLDETTFGAGVERHRRELHVHCYRMLGSLEESEDLVQETFLRAWRRRDSFEGRAPLRAWLYKIATNACLDALDKRPRTVSPAGEVRWVQAHPDQ